MSYEVTRGIILVVGRVIKKFWGVSGGFGGVTWALGGLRGSRGSTLPKKGTFCPSGCLVRHQFWVQTLHNGPTGQAFLSKHH